MATFTTRFLGCKVSFADEQAIRERLLADGHMEALGAGEIAVINTCCVTNEAVSKSRQATAQAARSHGRVYVTGCAANLSESAFDGLPDNVRVVARRGEDVAEAVAGDVGAIGCVQAAHRLDRVRAFVKIQDRIEKLNAKPGTGPKKAEHLKTLTDRLAVVQNLIKTV